MKQSKLNNNNKPQSSIGWSGIFVGLLVLVLLNSLLFPYVGKQPVKDADYNTFIAAVDKGTVKSVNIKEGSIYYEVAGKKGDQYFRTTEVNDPQLVERLLKAKSPPRADTSFSLSNCRKRIPPLSTSSFGGSCGSDFLLDLACGCQ